LGLEEEDGVALEDRRSADRVWRDVPSSPDRALRIGVVALPYMANFTDFDAVAMEPSVAVAFLDDPAQVKLADVLILPGSKQTLDDLAWLRSRGFAAAVTEHGGPLIGICGGYQMLGLSIEDPAGVENAGVGRMAAGLGMLPVRTVMRERKTVRVTEHARGYEIHMGETSAASDVAANESGRVWGTYVHGLFDDDTFRHEFLDRARAECGLAAAREKAQVTANRQARIDRWADHLRQSLNLELIRGWTGLKRYELTPTND
jgi:adenosylcobyric acid synthase